MINASPQPRAEPQQELRFGVSHDTEFFLALQQLDNLSKEPIDARREIGLTAVKKIVINPNDKYELSDFVEYADGIRGLSDNGAHLFELDTDFMDEKFYRADPDNGLSGLQFHLLLPTWLEQHTILRPPFIGPRRSLDPKLRESAYNALRAYKRAGLIPVKFEVDPPIFGYQEAVKRARQAVKMGVTVAGMHLATPGKNEHLQTAS